MTEEKVAQNARLEQAKDRLDLAVSRLALAVDGCLSGPEKEDASGQEFEALQRENAALKAANETTSNRLENSIKRLRVILEE
jgi:hypothetical protein